MLHARRQSAHHPHELSFEAYGVIGALNASRPELLDRARSVLPPGWTPANGAVPPGGRFSIAHHNGAIEVRVGDTAQIRTVDLDVALAVLDAQVRAYVSLQAPERIFVHAGAVANDGGAILIPGLSFSGKTTLVAALVHAGATYYSDEYAVLDEHGLVHPYPKPLSIRAGARRGTDHAVTTLGGEAGTDPLRVALIAVTSYRPGARWNPQRQSPGAGAMALLSNTVPARDRPAQALAAIRQAAASAAVLEGERGEAAETAAHLLTVFGANRRS